MGLQLTASTPLEEAVAGETATTTGKVEFDLGSTTREYPLQIVFCIDVSGSMSSTIDSTGLVDTMVSEMLGGGDGPAKIDVAKDGLLAASRRLTAKDTFGVVAFSGSAKTVVSPTRGDAAGSVRSDIEALSAGGSTDIADGLSTSRSMLQSMPTEDAIQWIVLLTDGKGTTPSTHTLEGDYADRGITIQAAGVGDDYSKNTLMEIAQHTQGETEHISAGRELKDFFEAKVQDARSVVAIDPELRLDPAPMTEITDVFFSLGTEQSAVGPDWAGETCVLDLADINQQQPPTVSFELELTPEDVDFDATVLEATLETDSDSITDQLSIAVESPHVVEAKPATAHDEEFLVRKITDTAMNDGARPARQEYRKHKSDLSQSAQNEIEAQLGELASGEKEEADIASLPAQIEDN